MSFAHTFVTAKTHLAIDGSIMSSHPRGKDLGDERNLHTRAWSQINMMFHAQVAWTVNPPLADCFKDGQWVLPLNHITLTKLNEKKLP
jgi:hypothetical protein